MIKDIKKLGYSEVILKCDGEPAVKSVQEEVTEGGRKPPCWRTLQWERAVRMRAVLAIGEQVRVLRRGLERRLGLESQREAPRDGVAGGTCSRRRFQNPRLEMMDEQPVFRRAECQERRSA